MNLKEIVVNGRVERPRKILCYGEHATGKTWWSARFPKPLIICVEDGAGDLDVAKVPTSMLQSAASVMEIVSQCAESEYETIIIDSVDWFDKLVEESMHDEGFDVDFGKGVVELGRRMGKLLSLLDKCVDAGKTVIMLAHHEVRTATNIQGRTWDRVQPKLTKRACERVLEWCDECFLAMREDFVKKEKGSHGRETGVATTSGRRVLKTGGHPSYVAKRRRNLPDEIDMDSDISMFLGNGAKL